MLSLTARRAQIEDGMRVLDLGCGWGSLSLWVAENFPRCQVTAVSNSVWQQRFIRRRAEAAGLTNVQCVQADMNEFDPERRFDRVVSIEMFEHMRNYEQLLARIAGWLESDGRLFVHTFCHQRFAYFFEVEGDDDWMARYFFTGGMMPSFDLISRFDRDLRLATQWFVDGQHYQKTLLAWLDRLDRQRQQTVETLAKCYGPGQAELWLQRWRMFLLACAELFGYKKGGEWFVGHYLLEPTPRP